MEAQGRPCPASRPCYWWLNSLPGQLHCSVLAANPFRCLLAGSSGPQRGFAPRSATFSDTRHTRHAATKHDIRYALALTARLVPDLTDGETGRGPKNNNTPSTAHLRTHTCMQAARSSSVSNLNCSACCVLSIPWNHTRTSTWPWPLETFSRRRSTAQRSAVVFRYCDDERTNRQPRLWGGLLTPYRVLLLWVPWGGPD
jgi:hypothetical protein